ncbi:glutamate racemase [Candidatus Saccharibacteria bacterium]|nr:glutamate racemase [Candidatus Saccharibacteria bacterium]
MKIGIFDSGKGGTTIMAAIKKLLKNEEYFYIADSKNCPYGEKSDEELQKIVIKNVEILKNWGAKIIIIACNTATVKCISTLRQKYPEISFVGTEPAIKLATSTDAKNILVLATPGTVKSERTHQLLTENQKKGQNITLLPCPGLADTIENNIQLAPDYQPLPLTKTAKDVINNKLRTLFQDIETTPDIIVLGCTHYSLIKPEIQSFFKTSQIIDGNSGVAHRTAAIINKLR